MGSNPTIFSLFGGTVDTLDLESISEKNVGSNPTKDKMLDIYNKTVNYYFKQNKKLFGLIISSYKGWGIIMLKKKLFFLLKKKDIHFTFIAGKKYSKILTLIFFGFCKGYFNFLKIKGMGYKFIRLKNNIIVKFGFCHRVIYKNYLDIYCLFLSKFILRFESRSLWLLMKTKNIFKNIRKKNIYKKKGIFLKGSFINIKVSSKKSKF